MNVQGGVADDPIDSDHGAYEAITCIACCSRPHMVNPKTGKLLGEEGDE